MSYAAGGGEGRAAAGLKVTARHGDEAMVLKLLLDRVSPKIGKHFDKLDVSMLWFSEWLHGLFTTVSPMRVTVRIWDILMCEGWKAWFRFALAIFLVREKQILGCSELEDVMMQYKLWPQGLDTEELVQAAFSFRLRRADIRKLRVKVQNERAQKKKTK